MVEIERRSFGLGEQVASEVPYATLAAGSG